MRFIPNSRTARVGLVVAVTATLALSSAAAATAAGKNKNQYKSAKVNACYNPTTGSMHLVQAATKCKKGEKRLIWDRVAPKGARGLTGLAGPQGIRGAQGAPGVAGAKGDTGNVGANGADGSQGQTGGQGLPGADGLNGADGADAYYLATHLEVDPFVGTLDEWITSLQGQDGTNGDNGDNGAPGTPGADGTPGAPGTPGADGAPGAPGAKGDTGSKGDTGTKGDTGAQGAAGAAWATTNPTGFNNNGTNYTSFGGSLTSTTESNVNVSAPVATSISGFSVRTNASSQTTLAVTLFKNGSATALTCTVNTGSTSTTCTSSGTAVTYAAGDTLSFRSVQAGSNGTDHNYIRITAATSSVA